MIFIISNELSTQHQLNGIKLNAKDYTKRFLSSHAIIVEKKNTHFDF